MLASPGAKDAPGKVGPQGDGDHKPDREQEGYPLIDAGDTIDREKHRQAVDEGCGDDAEHDAVCQLLDASNDRVQAVGFYAYLETVALDLADDTAHLLRQLGCEVSHIKAGFS